MARQRRDTFQDEPETEFSDAPASHPVRIWSGIQEHLSNLGEALGLFLWLIFSETDEQQRGDGYIGIVKGGAPQKDDELSTYLGVSTRTVRRWRARLVEGDYIEAERTGVGYRYIVLRAKRWKKAWPETYLQYLAEKDRKKNGRAQQTERPGMPARAGRVSSIRGAQSG